MLTSEFAVQPLNEFTARRVAVKRAYRQSEEGRSARREYGRRWSKTDAGKEKARLADARRRAKRGQKPRGARQTREQRRAIERARHAGLRDKIIAHRGGRCEQCGFNDHRALQIDHVAGDGAADHDVKRGPGYYIRVLTSMLAGEGRYQILCANCNWIKAHTEGSIRRTSCGWT